MEPCVAGILAANMVRYSRLMGEYEASTLAASKAHHESLNHHKIAEHNGRISN